MKVTNNNAYLNLLELRRNLRIEDYREQMDRLESAMKKEKLQAHQEKQHQMVVSTTKVDVYV
jgi:hypothetical protein